MNEERAKVREMLNRNALTCVWLMLQLDKDGISTDKTELSSVLRGTRKGAKAETIIKNAIRILENYEKLMK